MRLASRQIPVRELVFSLLLRGFFSLLKQKSQVPEVRLQLLPKYSIFSVDRGVL
jgi:hypothetical protein